MELLVQKPQFDSSALKKGQAIHVKDTTRLLSGHERVDYDSQLQDIDTAALVTRVGRLEIEVSYVNMGKHEMRAATIPVDVVADGKIEIKVMEVVTK